MNKPQSLLARIDNIFFIKKGYSIWKHLIPFSIAALLLVVMSLPNDNLLVKLVNILEQPGWLWIPAALLSFVALGVYFASVYMQVRQTHLWTDRIFICSLVTAITYLLLCSLMAYGVLWAANYKLVTSSAVWACFLLATFSLTGIGWSIPDEWVKTLDITIPDYAQARTYARDLRDTVARTSIKPFGTEGDIKDFLNSAERLIEELKNNKNLEPVWAKSDPDPVINDISELIELTNKYFKLDDNPAVERFPSACKFEADEAHYPRFVPVLNRIKRYWLTWKR